MKKLAILSLISYRDGELKENLARQARQLNVEKAVTFTGSRDDVQELMQAMDVFVLPSLREGLPVVGVEAQAAGLPCQRHAGS